jgi:hypothetical protein
MIAVRSSSVSPHIARRVDNTCCATFGISGSPPHKATNPTKLFGLRCLIGSVLGALAGLGGEDWGRLEKFAVGGLVQPLLRMRQASRRGLPATIAPPEIFLSQPCSSRIVTIFLAVA